MARRPERYIGDVARMAVLGEPNGELKDCLAAIEAVQRAAFAAVRPGAMGGDICVAAERQLAQISQRDCTDFLAHGMGLVSHEAPRLTAKGPVRYEDTDARQPLEPRTVISIETTMKHARRGFIKLEDTVAVTPTGYETLGTAVAGGMLAAAGPRSCTVELVYRLIQTCSVLAATRGSLSARMGRVVWIDLPSS
ncbi:M24 family metallopeptidase [Bradyrhizobium glycinis]|uniref:M24 family metallopeptidase n=1 Tax=Bradyrhizobium glycinis TaxID=2751812 RepID=UPI001FE681DB|nr:M24 family metallopeptidase [Bradyrhizobium glycinis]